MAAAKFEILVKAYLQQVSLYEKMLALAKEQSRCLSEANYPILEEIAERRLRLQDEIDDWAAAAQEAVRDISAALGLVEFNLSGLQGKLPEPDIARLAVALERITSTITAIQAEDDRNMTAIKSQMEGVRGQFSEMDRARQAIRAYNPIRPTAARFVDKRR